MTRTSNIIDSRHPNYLSCMSDWEKWRLAHKGGDEFRDRYLEHFSAREERGDFNSRRAVTPIPAFAKAAVNDIRNSIYQRMGDVLRTGGSGVYMRAVAGLDDGVDRRGSTMTAFLGMKVLTDLLVMGRVGVYVDHPVVEGVGTLADAAGRRPYLYSYQVEDILSWACSRPEEPSEFQSLLLRDSCIDHDERTGLPTRTFQRYRLLWIDPTTGKVNLQLYDTDGKPIDRNGNTAGLVQLELDRIPFVLLDIGDSLIKDVCQHQIALLNLGSSDVNHALKANFPFYIEQRDPRTIIDAKNAGLVGEKMASIALGFDQDEHLAAREDHTARILRIAAAQTSNDDKSDPAARGIDDLSTDPVGAGSDEKAESRDNTLRDTTTDRTRGVGKEPVDD